MERVLSISIPYRSAFISLSAGDIVGITLGSLAMVVAVGVVAFYIMMRRKDKKQGPYEPVAFTGGAPTMASTFSTTHVHAPSSSVTEIQSQSLGQGTISCPSQFPSTDVFKHCSDALGDLIRCRSQDGGVNLR